ncbi:unnamed protein product [Larinioides sclopetarius]|uniref:UMA domain-containing protein n=1 Tax=Larinioides sclopetarius TaxID=280406 RepID=A0AAV2BKP2_9ARAC
MDSHFKDGSSYIEGVPVKISKQFWPPRPVSLPQAIDTRTPVELLSIQYDFSLERSVIDYSEKRLKEIEEAKQKPKKGSANPEKGAGSSSIPGESIPKSSTQHVLPWQSNTILQPQQPPDKEKTPLVDKNTRTKINLSDFENDTSSPFDYMELQTINDLEELNSVFQGIHSSEPISSETSSVPDEEAVPTVAKSVSFPLPQNSWQTTSDKISASRSEDFGNINKTGAESTDLTNLSSPSQRVTSVIEEDVVSSVAKCESYPLPQNPWQISSDRITSSSSQEFVTNVKNLPSSSNGYSAFSSSVPKAVKDFSCDNSSFSNLSQVPYIPSNAGGSCEKALSLRGSKSYTDIRSISEMESVNLGIRERSHTPPTFNSGVIEPVNDVLQMEPLPINENHFQKPPDESSNGIVHDEKSAYEELDDAAKHFVDCITEMGFPKGQAARAVKHLGVDEKKVVELLCHIQALEESGYDSSEAEAALHLHDYNRDQISFLNHETLQAITAVVLPETLRKASIH